MRRILVRLVIIFGIITIIVPFIMIYLWNTYVTEQEAAQGSVVVDKQPCEPYHLELTRTIENRVEISWSTKQACSGFLLLGTTYADFGNLPYKVMPITEHSTAHTLYKVTLQKQDELQYTYALIVSDNQWYGIHGQPFILPKVK